MQLCALLIEGDSCLSASPFRGRCTASGTARGAAQFDPYNLLRPDVAVRVVGCPVSPKRRPASVHFPGTWCVGT